MQHRDIERHCHLVGQVTVEVDVRTRGQRGGRIDDPAVRQNHFSGKHFRSDTEPLLQLVVDVSTQQPQPGRAESVPHRQRRR